MCRCLKVSPSGYYGWRERPPSARVQDNQRLLNRIQVLHAESDGVLGSPRMCEELHSAGESCGLNRVERLMQVHAIQGIPQRARWRMKPVSQRPSDVHNHRAGLYR